MSLAGDAQDPTVTGVEGLQPARDGGADGFRVIPRYVPVLLVVGAWGAVLVLGASTRAFTFGLGVETRAPWTSPGRQLQFVGPWILLTPAVISVARRFRPSDRRWAVSVVIHLAGVAGVTVLHAAANALLHRLSVAAPPPGFRELFAVQISSAAPMSCLFYVTVVAAAHGYDFLVRSKRREVLTPRLEARLAQAQMMTLRTRLQPDLLVDILEKAAELVRPDPERARGLLVRLGDLLRANLETSRRPLVRLREEIELVRLYTELRVGSPGGAGAHSGGRHRRRDGREDSRILAALPGEPAGADRRRPLPGVAGDRPQRP